MNCVIEGYCSRILARIPLCTDDLTWWWKKVAFSEVETNVKRLSMVSTHLTLACYVLLEAKSVETSLEL